MTTDSVRERLTESRDLLLAAMHAAEPRELPSLAREYRATLADIASLPDESKRTTLDDLKAKRAARKSTAQDRARTTTG